MSEPQAELFIPGVQSNEDEDIAVLGRLNLQAASLNAELEFLDSAIVAVLEKGDQIIGVNEYGTSLWAETKRVDPRGCGPCAERKGTYFFICDYLDLTHELPDAVDLGKKLAEFHLKSKSPTGKFGFQCTTFDGKNPLNTSWDSSWTTYFRRLMNDIYQIEKASNGYSKEFDDVIQIALNKLVPRLLDALVADGRTIKPTLIHGDLWESNIGTDEQTDEVYIYDACAYYAHHEKEVGIWRCAHHKMTDEKYRREYFKHYPPSEPREEADDRNRLYAAQTMIVTSLDFPGQKMRELIMSDLNYLIDKYRLRDE
ncbi:hypothetical protein PG988_013957 [Apiospora saccharicola]